MAGETTETLFKKDLYMLPSPFTFLRPEIMLLAIEIADGKFLLNEEAKSKIKELILKDQHDDELKAE